jgi:hypothetical protein
MKLLVSPINIKEALEAIRGGADIIDVKNPREGSLGASYPWVIREIKDALPAGIELSAPLGDLEYKPGTASLAALGLVGLGVDYIKVGLYGVRNRDEALDMGVHVVRAVGETGPRVVLAGYADHRLIGSLDPLVLPSVAQDCGAHGVMIDTARKNGKTLLDHMTLADLNSFTEDAHARGVFVALAGSLDLKEIETLMGLGCDIVGVRGAVCSKGDRVRGNVVADKVKELKRRLR